MLPPIGRGCRTRQLPERSLAASPWHIQAKPRGGQEVDAVVAFLAGKTPPHSTVRMS